MRLVLDTNVVFSALLWRGPPYRLLELVQSRSNVQIYSSPVLIAELADVLGRPSATRRLAMIGRDARDVLVDYVAAVEVVEPVEVPRVVPNDIGDDHVIAAAVAAYADLIVSGDSDLLSMGSYQSIGIVRAATAIELVGKYGQ